MMSELLTSKEVSDLLGWTEKQTKNALVNDTSFPRPMTRSGRKYFDEDAVIEWADNNGIEIYGEEETDEELDDDDG